MHPYALTADTMQIFLLTTMLVPAANAHPQGCVEEPEARVSRRRHRGTRGGARPTGADQVLPHRVPALPRGRVHPGGGIPHPLPCSGDGAPGWLPLRLRAACVTRVHGCVSVALPSSPLWVAHPCKQAGASCELQSRVGTLVRAARRAEWCTAAPAPVWN
jgi:hypothetical protein